VFAFGVFTNQHGGVANGGVANGWVGVGALRGRAPAEGVGCNEVRPRGRLPPYYIGKMKITMRFVLRMPRFCRLLDISGWFLYAI
jgi:hypothetical protein